MLKSKSFRCMFCAIGSLLMVALPASAQKSKSPANLQVIHGPTNAMLGTVAQITVPEDYVFLDGKSTRALLEAEGEPVNGHELGCVVNREERWSVFFDFSEIGYVKDDEKDKLDADKLLESIRQGTAEGNKVRQSAGKPSLEVVGWEIPPKYDAATHNLEWAIRLSSGGRPILNYNTRLLGRKGVMEVTLVVSPEKLSDTLPGFRKLLTGHSFQSGQNYAEYRAGDKVAKYGLGALVVGGSAVAAAKLGLFAWLGLLFKKAAKLVILVVVAAVAFLRKLFTGRRPKAPDA